jgi:hypothetical protein
MDPRAVELQHECKKQEDNYAFEFFLSFPIFAKNGVQCVFLASKSMKISLAPVTVGT